MGANTTQAAGLLVFLLAFTCLAAGLAGGGFILLVLAVAMLAGSAFLFMKCKPWEHQDK